MPAPSTQRKGIDALFLTFDEKIFSFRSIKARSEIELLPAAHDQMMRRPVQVSSCAFLLCPALGHDGRVEPLAKLRRNLVDVIPAVDFDRLSRRIQNDLAMTATCQVSAYLFEQFRADLSIEVVG